MPDASPSLAGFCPARFARPRASRLRRVPRVLHCRHKPKRISRAGANHRALRHPREARLTPQARLFSCELIQRYSRRARRDAATGRHAPAGDGLRRSPESVWSIWAAQGAQARQRLRKGHFWVLFVARDKKYSRQRRPAPARAPLTSAQPHRASPRKICGL